RKPAFNGATHSSVDGLILDMRVEDRRRRDRQHRRNADRAGDAAHQPAGSRDGRDPPPPAPPLAEVGRDRVPGSYILGSLSGPPPSLDLFDGEVEGKRLQLDPAHDHAAGMLINPAASIRGVMR